MRFSGQRLRTERERVGVRREELAVRVGRSYIAIFRFEHGDLQPSLRTAAALAEALGVRVDDLMDRDLAGAR